MRMDLLIAKALRTDLNESVYLSMKAVSTFVYFQGPHFTYSI